MFGTIPYKDTSRSVALFRAEVVQPPASGAAVLERYCTPSSGPESPQGSYAASYHSHRSMRSSLALVATSLLVGVHRTVSGVPFLFVPSLAFAVAAEISGVRRCHSL